MSVLQNAFSVEFRRDVVAVARQSDASISQVARELGISDGCVHRWLNFDDSETGRKPGVA